MGSSTSFLLPWPGFCKNIEFVFTASNVYLFRLFVCLFVCFILFVSLFVCFFSGERDPNTIVENIKMQIERIEKLVFQGARC